MLNSFDSSAPPSTIVDLSLSLDDINKQIFSQILYEENMNYSKAAKRLGVSRATLYRKIGKHG